MSSTLTTSTTQSVRPLTALNLYLSISHFQLAHIPTCRPLYFLQVKACREKIDNFLLFLQITETGQGMRAWSI